ncbi:hypothetical protein OH76DRAFT_1185855 [Lentinus brumalis]|uniref:Uncharacterized protein n=1 Tax=Lentinus brumalis TaxID=2498619 RepID=A0A371CTP2_9APHY|nr:hypothetical protein OH76DRAFT_1185855 [Polyporus brumalis]
MIEGEMIRWARWPGDLKERQCGSKCAAGSVRRVQRQESDTQLYAVPAPFTRHHDTRSANINVLGRSTRGTVRQGNLHVITTPHQRDTSSRTLFMQHSTVWCTATRRCSSWLIVPRTIVSPRQPTIRQFVWPERLLDPYRVISQGFERMGTANMLVLRERREGRTRGTATRAPGTDGHRPAKEAICAMRMRLERHGYPCELTLQRRLGADPWPSHVASGFEGARLGRTRRVRM